MGLSGRQARLFGTLAITPSLLPSLPNLETLRSIRRKYERLQYVEEFVNAVVESQRRSENPQALSKLVSLTIMSYEGEDVTEFKWFLPFMQPPSLREISVQLWTVEVWRIYQSYLFLAGGAPQASPKCRPQQNLLDTSRWLQSAGIFSISPFSNGGFDPRSMRDALLEHHRHTLDELYVASRGLPHALTSSLRGFTTLEVIRLNSQKLHDGSQMSRLVQILHNSMGRQNSTEHSRNVEN